MAQEPPPGECPEGAAVFPEIPAELGVDPLLLATLHAYVLLNGSDPAVLHPAVAEEALNYMVTYLRRLQGERLRRVKEDLLTLAAFARAEKWPRQQVRFLQEFLKDNGIAG